MALADTKEKIPYVSLGTGTLPARIVHVIDMGKQHEKGYNKSTKQWYPLFYAKDAEGNDIKNEEGYTKKVADDTGFPCIRPEYRVTYEFATKRREYNGEMKPRWLKKDYTFVGLQKLAKMLSNDDILGLVNSPCLVNVGQTSGGYDKVVSVSPPIDGMEVAPLENPAVLFDFDGPEKEQWDNIPPFYKEDIQNATNYPGSKLSKLVEAEPAEQPAGFDDFDDDIPY